LALAAAYQLGAENQRLKSWEQERLRARLLIERQRYAAEAKEFANSRDEAEERAFDKLALQIGGEYLRIDWSDK
jgi:hypothetical protein